MNSLNTVVSVNLVLWICSVVCFLVAVVLPFTGRKTSDGTADITPMNSGRLNLVALGLLFAALTHLTLRP